MFFAVGIQRTQSSLLDRGNRPVHEPPLFLRILLRDRRDIVILPRIQVSAFFQAHCFPAHIQKPTKIR